MNIALPIGTLTLLMSPLLFPFLRFAMGSDLYSHTILVPFVSIYLLWGKRSMFSKGATSLKPYAAIPGVFAICSLFLYFFLTNSPVVDRMSLIAGTYVFSAWALALYFLGREAIRHTLFAWLFLAAMIPMPTVVRDSVEHALQLGSAECAYWMFRVAGTTLYRDGLVFHLPGIALEVAPECSGIRSSLVLLITSLVGGHLFLRSPWRKLLLTLFVVPLALIRNGFRVFVLGQLCVNIGPHIIDSPIHHQGGPIFFALSLIPFSALVWFLIRRERNTSRPPL